MDDVVVTIDKKTSKIVENTDELSQEYLRKKTITEKADFIVQYIKQNKDVTKNIPNYKTNIIDLKLLYSLRLIGAFSPCNYATYITAFKLLGVSENIRPNDAVDIFLWDREYYNICYAGFYVAYMKTYNSIKFNPSNRDHFFETFNITSSGMKYGEWQFSKVESYQRLSELFKRDSVTILDQIRYNNKQSFLDGIQTIPYTVYNKASLSESQKIFKNLEILSNKNNGDYNYSKGVTLNIPIDNMECFLTDKKIQEIQTKLNQKGFFVGKTDGIIGPSTRTQIEKFNRKNKIYASDYVSKQFYEKLFEN
nr:peptidoglycan-binding domain-containing protein [uncultured Desulfobacter sp.]